MSRSNIHLNSAKSAAAAILLCLAFTLCTMSPIALATQPLTNQAGDANAGRLVFLDVDRGHCLLCHQLSGVDAPFQGNIGPTLDGVGARYPASYIRARIVDPTLQNPNTVMPAYHRVHNLRQVGSAYIGKPILSAQEIEDLVAFMLAQKQQPKVATP